MSAALSYLLQLQGVGIVRRGWGGVHEVYCLMKGDVAFSEAAIRCLRAEWKR